MNKEKFKKTSPAQALVVLLMICIIIYFTLRALFIGYAEYEPGEKVLAIFFFLSEAYVMFHAFGYFAGVYRISRFEKTKLKSIELTTYPSVAILIPSRHEPKEVLENTILACYNLSYPAKTIYVLDDSTEEKYKKEAEELSRNYNCCLFQRKIRHGAKAGVIDDCLKELTEKYIAIFDVDQNPIDGFLTEIIPILEASPQLALIQTPQYYSNLGTNKVAFAADMQQAVFYEYVCEAKSASQSMICCGTNVVLRREALNDVGGFDESTVTEDFATSFKFHLKGWKTLYYNHVNTFGQGPSDLASYLKQQNRWANGNVAVLKKVLAQLFKSPRSLRFVQWWEYIVTGSYYLVGWAYLFLILCPIIYVFFNLPSFFMNPVIYGCSFLPYLILASVLFSTRMSKRHYRYLHILKGQLLFFLSLPTYLRGSLMALVGVKKGFQITPKQGTHTVAYIELWPQLSFWALNLAAITWGINRFIYDRSPAVLVNVIWIIYHFLLFSSLFYFNED